MPMFRCRLRSVSFAILALCWAMPLVGAEICLRAEAQVSGSVVRLGDLAEIITADPLRREALAAVELGTAPAAGPARYVRVREIEDHLLQQGISLADLRFTGAAQVAVSGQQRRAPPAPARLTRSALNQAQQTVEGAIAEYLRAQMPAYAAAGATIRNEVMPAAHWSAPPSSALRIECNLDEAQARIIAAAIGPMQVSGGHPPWSGLQRFQIALPTAEGVQTVALETRVTLPLTVVVATGGIHRGSVIRPDDVMLQHVLPGTELGDALSSLDAVVGKEAARSIAPGQMLTPQHVRAPLVVRRGEVVTVYSRSGGISVRTTGRAREDGSVGDLIAVESLHDRETFFARVSGIQQVEVYAGGMLVSPAP
jgi:flagella basal body P-ring formation protein FlgA